MTPIELRIGNFVGYKDFQHFYEVRSFSNHRLHPVNLIEHENNTGYAVDCELGDLKPIPLTPKLLEAAGFSCSEGSRVWMMKIKYQDGDYPCTLQQTGDGIQICRSGIGAITAPVYFIHQLQNLFFSLVGTELNINL